MLSLAWSPDGSVVASGCQDNNVHCLALPAGQGHGVAGDAAEAAPAELERRQPAAGHDRRPRRHGLERRAARRARRRCRCGWSVRPAWRPRSRSGRRRLLATGYRNGMVHIWTPREHDQPVGVQPLDGQIEALAWGPPAEDGRDDAAAAGGGDRRRLAGGVGDRSSGRPAATRRRRRSGAIHEATCRRCTCTSCADVARA